MKEHMPKQINKTLIQICDLIRNKKIKFSSEDKEILRRTIDILGVVIKSN